MHKTCWLISLLAAPALAQDCAANPAITEIKVAAADPNHATITWTTNCLADSMVSWSYENDDNPANLSDVYDASPACYSGCGATGTLKHAVTVYLPTGASRMAWVRSRAISDPKWYTITAAPNITTTPAPAGDFDYETTFYGSHKVFQGSTVWIEFNSYLVRGADPAGMDAIVSGTPPNSRVIGDTSTSCSYSFNPALNLIHRYRTVCEPTNFGIATTGMTPVGKYRLKITIKRSTNVPPPRDYFWDLEVEPPAAFTVRRPQTFPAIPCLTQYSRKLDGTACSQSWQSMMVTYGQKWCGQIAPGWEGAVWYYDGTRVFYNVRDWDRKYHATTNPEQWTQCIETQHTSYRDWVNSLSSVAAWRIFPHGLAMHFMEKGDQGSKDALLKFRYSPYSTPNNSAMILPSLVRELSYRIEADIVDTIIFNDGTRLANLRKELEISMGRADQYLTGQIPLQPFMTGLWMESMISCYEAQACPMYRDPRIPVLIRRVADWMWQAYGITRYKNSWPYTLQGFTFGFDATYNNSLNLLIQFAYAWLWSITGEREFQKRSDRAFEDGVLTLPGDGCDYAGKNYSQQYRLSFAAVRYRTNRPPSQRFGRLGLY